MAKSMYKADKNALKLVKSFRKHEQAEADKSKKVSKAIKTLERHEKAEMKARK